MWGCRETKKEAYLKKKIAQKEQALNSSDPYSNMFSTSNYSSSYSSSYNYTSDFDSWYLSEDEKAAKKKEKEAAEAALAEKKKLDLESAKVSQSLVSNSSSVAVQKLLATHPDLAEDLMNPLKPDFRVCPLAAQTLTEDHRPDKPEEKARIEATGLAQVESFYVSSGTVRPNDPRIVTHRLPHDLDPNNSESRPQFWPALNMSRVLGDLHTHEQGASYQPAVRLLDAKSGDYLVVASDGVWDVLDTTPNVEDDLDEGESEFNGSSPKLGSMAGTGTGGYYGSSDYFNKMFDSTVTDASDSSENSKNAGKANVAELLLTPGDSMSNSEDSPETSSLDNDTASRICNAARSQWADRVSDGFHDDITCIVMKL